MATNFKVDPVALKNVGNKSLQLKENAQEIISKVKNDINGVKEYWEDVAAKELLVGFEEELVKIEEHFNELKLSSEGLISQSADITQLQEEGKNAFGSINLH